MSYYIVDRMGGGAAQDRADPPIAQMIEHLDSLDPNDQEHPSVCLVHRESGWGIEVFESGLLVLENTSIRNSQKHIRGANREKTLSLWKTLASGDIEAVMSEPWIPGYGS